MSKAKKRIIILLAIMAYFVAVGVLGYFMGGNAESVLKKNIQEDEAAVAKGDAVLLSATITFQYKYDMCGHMETKTETVPGDLIGLYKSEVAEIYPEYSLRSFAADKIVLLRTYHTYCGEHYVLKLIGDSTLNVYRTEKYGGTANVEKTYVLLNRKLDPTTQKQLENGKVFSSIAEIETYVTSINFLA